MSSQSNRIKELPQFLQALGLSLPKFDPKDLLPTPFEMTEEKPARPRGMFEELLQSNPHSLSHLLKRDFEGCAPEVESLLELLVAGERRPTSLSPEERVLLDEATAEALSRPAQKRKVKKPFEHVQKNAKEDEEMYKEAEDDDEIPYEDPAATPNAFWWL